MLLLLLELHEHGRGGAEPRVLVVAVERGGVGVQKHGKGTYTWASGGKYVGQYKDNKRHGLGKYTLADGTVHHDGEWENNQPKK